MSEFSEGRHTVRRMEHYTRIQRQSCFTSPSAGWRITAHSVLPLTWLFVDQPCIIIILPCLHWSSFALVIDLLHFSNPYAMYPISVNHVSVIPSICVVLSSAMSNKCSHLSLMLGKLTPIADKFASTLWVRPCIYPVSIFRTRHAELLHFRHCYPFCSFRGHLWMNLVRSSFWTSYLGSQSHHVSVPPPAAEGADDYQHLVYPRLLLFPKNVKGECRVPGCSPCGLRSPLFWEASPHRSLVSFCLQRPSLQKAPRAMEYFWMFACCTLSNFEGAW